MLTQEQRNHLRALAEAASHGPWKTGAVKDDHLCRRVYTDDHRSIAWCGHFPIEQARADAQYIAAISPEVLLALLDASEVCKGERG